MAAKAWRTIVGGVVLGALVAAGCSSSSSSGGTATGGATATTVDQAVLGPMNKATGTPVKIGFIYPGSTPIGDNQDELAMAKATADYVNDHLGGIAGRPLELVTCGDNTTPAGATDCANQMLAAKVPVVLEPEPAQPVPIVNLLTPAKVPFMVWAGADTSVLTSADVSTVGNPLTLLAAPVKLAKDDGKKKIAMVYTDVPAAAELPLLAKPLYKKEGIGLLTTAVPLGAADVTPQIQAALSSGADEFLVIGDDTLCVNSLSALKTLGYQGKVVSNDNCLKSSAAKTLSGGFNGLVIAGTQATSNTNAEVALFHTVAATYAPQIQNPDSGTVPAHYASVLAFARAMKGLTADQLTSGGIADQLLTMSPQTMPLLAGATFQCDRKKSTLTPSVCSNGAVIETLDAEGDVTKSVTFDAGPYLSLGS